MLQYVALCRYVAQVQLCDLHYPITHYPNEQSFSYAEIIL